MRILGFVAATLTTLSFLPQVLRTVRTRSTGDLSWGFLMLFVPGVVTWLLYGLLREDLPVIAANGISLVLVVILVAIKAAEDLSLRRGADSLSQGAVRPDVADVKDAV